MQHISQRKVDVGSVSLHVAELGAGPGRPLVVLVHGFPESWYSWRHQLEALAAAGYHAVAPDLRGFGESDAPASIEAYDQVELASDIAGLIDALGVPGTPDTQRAVVVGHDWGAPVVYHTALLHPDKVRGVVGMSVPFGGRSPQAPLARMQALFKDMFFYMLYFQEPGVAEAELEADVRTALRMFYYSASGDAPLGSAFTVHPKSANLRDTLRDGALSFMSDAELDYYASRYQRSGFRGPLNLYRNFDRTWERLSAYADAKITAPALFIAGERDPVIAFSAKQLERMPLVCPNLRGTHMLAGAGHWIQQERPQEVNALLLEFLRGLPST